MEFKGTKGEWKFNDVSMSGKPHYNVIGTALGGKFKIANVPWVDGDKVDMQEALANAKLIAAAPELLEALQTIIGYNRQEAEDKYGDPDKAESWACVRTARAAITKALTI